jgi:2,3-bisphosphoglycerate-dependent phosphoglycerate mutase
VTPTTIVLHMHSTSEDNEARIATGWLPGRLSSRGRQLAIDLAAQRRRTRVDAVFTSDLRRAVETVELTFGHEPSVPVLHDWRLRECDFGDLNGAETAVVHGRRLEFLDQPYPAGESWRQAIDRVGRFVADLATRWQGATVMLFGHASALYGLPHLLEGRSIEELLEHGVPWQDDYAGWNFTVPSRADAGS